MTIPAAVALPLLVGYAGASYASSETAQIRVEDKTTGWQQTQEPGTPRVQFLVYTDGGVFQVGIEPPLPRILVCPALPRAREGWQL